MQGSNEKYNPIQIQNKLSWILSVDMCLLQPGVQYSGITHHTLYLWGAGARAGG